MKCEVADVQALSFSTLFDEYLMQAVRNTVELTALNCMSACILYHKGH